MYVYVYGSHIARSLRAGQIQILFLWNKVKSVIMALYTYTFHSNYCHAEQTFKVQCGKSPVPVVNSCLWEGCFTPYSFLPNASLQEFKEPPPPHLTSNPVRL